MYTNTELQMLRNADGGALLPGIDTPVGNLAPAASLTAASSFPTTNGAPIRYNAQYNSITVSQAGAVLNGINFGSTRLLIAANNVTVENCTFTASSGSYAVYQGAGVSGATIQNCTFTGPTYSTPLTDFVASGSGYITVKNNSFINAPQSAVGVASGVVTGNYFSGGGYQVGAHPDAIVVDSGNGVSITDNFIDWTPIPGASVGSTDPIRITANKGNCSNVTVSGNFVIGGVYSVDAGNQAWDGAFSNVSVTGNYMGFSNFGVTYGPTYSGVTVSGNVVFDFTNPTFSTTAWAAYKAAGLPTAYLVTSTGANISSGSMSGPTTLYGGGNQVYLGGSLVETNFVGGFGTQYLVGGAGANVFTELAVSDSTPQHYDVISSFNPAKDVIDLSHVDADVTTAGLQNFTFIGANAFTGSGGGQVRYQQDPANNATYVQAALAGDTSPDLYIKLYGLQTLSAANFALTTGVTSVDPPVTDQSGASAAAWAAYQSAGLPTAYLVTSTGGNINSGSMPGPTTLYGGGYQVYLGGSLVETNFVGGGGTQYLVGGAGANVFTELAVSDSTPQQFDVITNFNPAKDVIDLSHIDADVTTAGLQNFTFIGANAFTGSGGGQVRYQQDPANNATYVEAALAGDTSPDLYIKLYGLQTLSAANFALTTGVTSVDPPVTDQSGASAAAWAAYQSAGLPTASLVTSTGANISSGSMPGPTTLYGGGYQVYLGGSLVETNFVGGGGTQYLVGGAGANVFTELAVSDSTPQHYDVVTNFDPAKDVIDLSHIDADVGTAGLQNFTFIGANAFTGSGGGQVRYQQDPANDATYVEAAFAGDTSPDLYIKLYGLQTLSAANFALTAAQSTADMAGGSALQVSANTISGSGTVYSYTNVQGKNYSSFAAFYTNATTRIADDLNLNSGSSELDLNSNNLTISRGSAAESLKAGTGSFSVGYRSNETIQAGAAGSEAFAFGLNFGNETITGFKASGANAEFALACDVVLLISDGDHDSGAGSGGGPQPLDQHFVGNHDHRTRSATA